MTPGGDSFTQPCGDMPTMPNLVGGSSTSVSSGLTYYGRGQSPPWLRHSPRSDPRSRFNDDRSSHGSSHYPTPPPPPPPRYSPQYHPEEYSRGGEHNYGGGGGNQYSRGGEHGGGGGGGSQYSRGGEHQQYREHGGGGGGGAPPRVAMQHHFLDGVGGDGGDDGRGEGTFQKLTRKDLRAMGVQIEQEKTYHQTTLSQHFPPFGDGDQEQPVVLPEEVGGGGENDDSVSHVSESQPRLEPPSAFDILAMEAQRRR